jgi:hypothetical protein
MRRVAPILSALLLASGLSACTMRKSAIWLEPDSSAQNVVFGVAQERHGSAPVFHLNYVAVRTCYSSVDQYKTLWQARGDLPKGESVPTRITYGRPPAGFMTEIPPQPLTPGCYEGLISGDGISGTVRFAVQPDGSVTEQRATSPGG